MQLSLEGDSQGISEYKMQAHPTDFHIVNSYSAPMTKTEYDEFQKQNIYACLDAKLAFHYTEPLHVQKLFKMMRGTVKMPNRKVVSRKILK